MTTRIYFKDEQQLVLHDVIRSMILTDLDGKPYKLFVEFVNERKIIEERTYRINDIKMMSNWSD